MTNVVLVSFSRDRCDVVYVGLVPPPPSLFFSIFIRGLFFFSLLADVIVGFCFQLPAGFTVPSLLYSAVTNSYIKHMIFILLRLPFFATSCLFPSIVGFYWPFGNISILLFLSTF